MKIALFIALLLMPLATQAQQLITPVDLVQKIERSPNAFVLFVFTSWCGYCKQQVEALRALHPAERVSMPEILAVSTDSDPAAFGRFLSEHLGMFWQNRLYAGSVSLSAMLRPYGSDYDGGIPYLAVFQKGKIIRQFNGFTPIENLKLAP
jgi:thiol-disulfide isomerase/thioredoxin